MADEDDKKLETTEPTGVDEQKTQDEPVVEDTKSTETPKDGEQTEEQKTLTFEKRYTQFTGETPEEYIKQLEDAYGNSSSEALKIKKRLDDLKAKKLTEVATGKEDEPTDGKQGEQPKSLTDIWVDQEMKRRHAEQYAKFAEVHPEVNEDDDLFNELDQETGKYMEYVFNREGRVPDLDESLNWAWKIIRPEDSKRSKEEKVVEAVKSAGSASKTKSVTKDPAEPLFSDKQIEAAKKIDPTLRDKSRAEIEEILAKYK